MVSGRLVRTTCASASASNSGTSTAAGRLPGITSGGGCGGGSAAQRSRTSANESRRRSAGTWLHGGGPSVRASGGRGMRCSPPRALIRSAYAAAMDWNFATVFESVADAIPDSPALVQDDRRRTWHEFDERAARLAAAFRALGLGPDSKVAFYLYNSHEYLFAALAPLAYSFFGLDMPDNSKDAGSRALKVHESGLVPVHLPASPLMHGTGQFSTLQALFLGGRIVTLESRHFDPDELWRVVQHERVSQIAIVGDAFAKPMLRALDEADARGEPYDLSSLLLVISSGVMWSESIKRELIERHPVIAYDSLGSSEGVGFANAITTTDSKGETAKFSVGPNTKVFTDDDRDVKPGSGEVGYLAVGGNIPLGYYKDRAKTKSTFREVDGKRYSIPGDYATVEEDGTVALLGRGSVSINSGGEKIFPEEVEEAVKQHPDVCDAVVVGVP